MGRSRTGVAFDLGAEAIGGPVTARGGEPARLSPEPAGVEAQIAPNYRVDRIRDAEHLEAFKRPLRVLADHALEPGPGVRYAWSRAALMHLSRDAAEGSVALVWRHTTEDEREPHCLVGAFALDMEPVMPGLPVRHAKSWRHLFSFSGVPLVHRDHAGDVLGAYFEWLFGPDVNAAGLQLEQIPVAGPFAEALSAATGDAGMPVRVLDTYERAVLEVPRSTEGYIADALPKKKRKELRRLRTRLAEQGDLEIHQFGPGDDLARWLADFYALEGRGWKGRAQSSLSCDPAWIGFFGTAFEEFHNTGDVLFWKLTLDGVPIAMTCGARSGRQAWLFKIAYDEDHARSSPGVLIVLDVMDALSRSGGIDMMDSCAQADHPMINRLWRERLQLHDVMIGRPAQPAAVFEALHGLTRLKRDGRALAKRFYKTYLKGGAK